MKNFAPITKCGALWMDGLIQIQTNFQFNVLFPLWDLGMNFGSEFERRKVLMTIWLCGK
jgi:hypothetical protein